MHMETRAHETTSEKERTTNEKERTKLSHELIIWQSMCPVFWLKQNRFSFSESSLQLSSTK